MSTLRANTPRKPTEFMPNPIDFHVVSRVPQRKTLMGLRQEKLGEALGFSFQQVQRYESGANQIGTSRLFNTARVLNAPIP